MYIWQNENWPHMKWQNDQLLLLLADANTLRGKLMGRLSMFGIAAQEMSMLNSITKEIVHSAEIEGEILNRDSVRLSVDNWDWNMMVCQRQTTILKVWYR